jgi:hypothetical protein
VKRDPLQSTDAKRSQTVLFFSRPNSRRCCLRDGSHIFHNVFVDLFYLREIVRPGGLVVLDDCEWPSVATAVRYFELNTGWEPRPLETTTRLRAYRLPDPRVEPTFESFAPFGENVRS